MKCLASHRAVFAALLLFLLAGCVSTAPFKDTDGHVIPGSIVTMESVEIGGVAQSIWFRSEDLNKPALIRAGMAESYFRRLRTPYKRLA